MCTVSIKSVVMHGSLRYLSFWPLSLCVKKVCLPSIYVQHYSLGTGLLCSQRKWAKYFTWLGIIGLPKRPSWHKCHTHTHSLLSIGTKSAAFNFLNFRIFWTMFLQNQICLKSLSDLPRTYFSQNLSSSFCLVKLSGAKNVRVMKWQEIVQGKDTEFCLKCSKLKKKSANLCCVFSNGPT